MKDDEDIIMDDPLTVRCYKCGRIVVHPDAVSVDGWMCGECFNKKITS